MNKVTKGDVWEAITERGTSRIFLILEQHDEYRVHDKYRYVELTSELMDVREFNLSIRRADKLPKVRVRDGVTCTHYNHIWRKLN